MEITINVSAPDLSDAIKTLATAISGQNSAINFSAATVTDAAAPVQFPGAFPAQQPPIQQMPLQQLPAQQMPLQQMPGQQLPAQQLPAQQLPGQIPTAVQTYTMEQLAVAATQLVDAGRRTELVALLALFGVQALTSLPKEMYGAFATQLRAWGAKI
jgi:hypothetical protein